MRLRLKSVFASPSKVKLEAVFGPLDAPVPNKMDVPPTVNAVELQTKAVFVVLEFDIFQGKGHRLPILTPHRRVDAAQDLRAARLQVAQRCGSPGRKRASGRPHVSAASQAVFRTRAGAGTSLRMVRRRRRASIVFRRLSIRTATKITSRLDERLYKDVHAGEDEPRLHHLNQQRPQDRAGEKRCPPPTEEACAAQHRRRDGVEFVALSEARIDDAELRNRHESSQTPRRAR